MNYDKDKDEKLSRDELPARMRGILTRSDAVKDGFATKAEIAAELKKAFQRNGGRRGPGGPRRPEGERGDRFGGGPPPGPVRGAEEFVSRAIEFDSDQNGKLSPEELHAMASSPRQKEGPRPEEANSPRDE